MPCVGKPEFRVSTHSRPKAAENGFVQTNIRKTVSTHSRPKAAVCLVLRRRNHINRFNTQPPEGGWTAEIVEMLRKMVSTHSRPKAAGVELGVEDGVIHVSTHSRPKAAGAGHAINTAMSEVSTHSRPKAAALKDFVIQAIQNVSTHSRPKAADTINDKSVEQEAFQHTAARRRLLFRRVNSYGRKQFQHTAARRRLVNARSFPTTTHCFNTQPPEGGW